MRSKTWTIFLSELDIIETQEVLASVLEIIKHDV